MSADISKQSEQIIAIYQAYALRRYQMSKELAVIDVMQERTTPNSRNYDNSSSVLALSTFSSKSPPTREFALRQGVRIVQPNVFLFTVIGGCMPSGRTLPRGIVRPNECHTGAICIL